MVAPKIYVGMPGYGCPEPEALTSGECFATRVPGLVTFQLLRSSAGPANFNSLWCNVLNMETFSHFGMIHQDVYPPKWWADQLLADLEGGDLDLLSVVLPIKDDRKLTSTAVLDPKTFRVRRLTLKEVGKLPKTFTSADLERVGYGGCVLLVSSGLWLCRLGGPWIERVWFEQPSRVVRGDDGHYYSKVWSEDWNFSVQLHQLGVKYAATTGLRVQHIGTKGYTNQPDEADPVPWETDAQWDDYSWCLRGA